MRPAACRKLFARTRLWGALLLVGTIGPRTAFAVSGPPGFVIESAFPGVSFNYPVQVVFLPDGRKFVVEQGGVIWTMTPSGARLPTPFIDLSDKVLNNLSGGRGLLGVALDPDFATNGWIYLAYTVDPDSNGADNNSEAFSRIERYQADATNPDLADLSTRQVLIGTSWSTGIPCPDTYHSIGALRFAPDKTLLVASGEGAHFDTTDAGGLDPDQFLPGRANPAEDVGSFRSLTLNSLAGKILRLDKETGHGLPSNPYWDGNPTSARSRAWIYGVRNPFRFAMRPGTGTTDPGLGQPGTLYIGDTGWNTYEAVHVAKQGGLNMGWPCQEGPSPQPLYQAVTSTAAGNTNVLCGASPSSENPLGATAPWLWWHHLDGNLSFPFGWTGYATTGGTFHQGSSYPPPYAGSYFVSEYTLGWIRWVQVDGSDDVISTGDFVSDAAGPVDLEWDPATGDLFYVSLYTSEVRRIRYLLADRPRAVWVRADSSSGNGPYPIPGAGSPWVDLVGPHDLSLVNFAGDATSGWQGNGSVLSPHRLSLDGVDDRVTLAAGSIPELANPGAATTALWFKTSSDVTATQYLFEWLADYAPPFAGMTMAISEGRFRVLLNSWVDVAAVQPNAWYHVAVAKQAGDARVFVNGQIVHSALEPNLGGQASEIVLGASTYRGAGVYGDFFSGSIAQMCTWPVALSDGEVLAAYQNGRTLFFPSGPKVVHLRADSASASGPYPVPGAASPWRDLIYAHDASLVNFVGTAASGWQGDGSIASPYRLAFDGVDDHVVIPAGSIAELQSPKAVTVGLWVKTGPDVTTTQYLCEWVSEYAAPFPGMTMAISGGNFRVLLNTWVDVAPVLPNTWYYLTVSKDGTSAVRAYVNQLRRLSASAPNLGGQASEVVLGASTFRGPGDSGEFFQGSIAQMRIWGKALIDPEVQEAFHESEPLYFEPPGLSGKVVHVRADSATGTGHYPVPGGGSPWRNLVGSEDMTLSRFEGDATSGWQGDGTLASPYRLQFDGLNDRATLRAGAITELQAPSAATVALWFRTASDVATTQYLFEWVGQYSVPYPGMTMGISGGYFRVFLNPWVDVAPVQPNTWYHVAVSKAPGAVLAYVNGRVVHSGASANLGGQVSEIVLGASTFRGNKKYGEFFEGSIAQMSTWPVALNAAGVREVFRVDSALYLAPTTLDVAAREAMVHLTALPNPFQKSSAIEFSLARPGDVELAIYGVDGRRVRTLVRGRRAAGVHRFPWDGKDAGGRVVSAGVYFVRLVGPQSRDVLRLVLLK